MFPDLGAVPVSLAIDLSAYEDDWRHVAAFRGQSGWLLMASATIQSEHDLLCATLIVACDDREIPIPAWRAKHLTQCAWSDLDYCGDEPPAILDDLMCEEEGALYAQWQREANSELAALHDKAQRGLEALEAKAASRTRMIDREISRLRRSRRMTDNEDMHRALTSAIIELEGENDAAVERLIRRREAMRRHAESTEEALWQRSDVLIEVEPLRLVQWRDASPRPEHRQAPIWKAGRFHAPKIATAHVEPEEAEAVLVKVAAAMQANAKRQAKEDVVDDIPVRIRTEDLPKSAPIRQQLTKDDLVAEAMQAWADQTLPAAPVMPTESEQLPLPEIGVDLKAERAALTARLEVLETRGQKFFPRSRKFERNQMERDAVSRQIAALDRRLAANGSENGEAQPDIGVDEHWSPERVARLRELWLEGYTARQIANDLGGTSRNAVIGKAKRIGIYFRSANDTRQANENSVSADL
jgi:hypothetical protein